MTSRHAPAPVDVHVLAWPEDADRLRALREEGVARLVLVSAGEDAPVPTDELEDWVRLPADPHEVMLRRRRLVRLAGERGRSDAVKGVPVR